MINPNNLKKDDLIKSKNSGNYYKVLRSSDLDVVIKVQDKEYTVRLDRFGEYEKLEK